MMWFSCGTRSHYLVLKYHFIFCKGEKKCHHIIIHYVTLIHYKTWSIQLAKLITDIRKYKNCLTKTLEPDRLQFGSHLNGVYGLGAHFSEPLCPHQQNGTIMLSPQADARNSSETVSFCHYSALSLQPQTAINDMQMNEHGCVLMKLYLPSWGHRPLFTGP